MYDALSVARHIIEFADKRNIRVSNPKLQKLLYFVQAEFLVSTPEHRPCFEDVIEVWDVGPVVPSVLRHYQVYGAGSILPPHNDPLVPYYKHIEEYDQKND